MPMQLSAIKALVSSEQPISRTVVVVKCTNPESFELNMETACPECGRSFAVPFGLPRFFFRGATYRQRTTLPAGALPGVPLSLGRTRDHGYAADQAAEVHRVACR